MSKLSNKTIVIISFTLILIGLLLISSDYLKSKKEKAYEKVRISLMTDVDNTPKNIDEPVEEPEPEPLPNGYLGILEIEKINLAQGFYDKDNPDNNVSKNVTFLEPSNYPDEKNGNTILVAHSGTSNIAYFKHLYQLGIGDTAKITYKGKTYTYKINNIYNEEKDGDVTIYRDTNKTTMTLVTCTKDSKTKQTVYILDLNNIENI